MKFLSSSPYRRIVVISFLFASLQFLLLRFYLTKVKEFLPPFNVTSYPMAVNLVALVQSIRNTKEFHTTPLYPKYDNYSIPNAAKCFPHNLKNNLIIIIKSNIHNQQRRDYLREYWANENCWKPLNVRRIFFIGGSDDSQLMASIYSEFVAHMDIVQFDSVEGESPRSSLKVYVAFQWLRDYCMNTDFVLMVEDSVDIRPNDVINYLKPKLSQTNFYAGNLILPPAIRMLYGNSLLSDPLITQWDQYSPYIGANVLVLSADVVDKMAIGMQFTTFLWIEEIYLAIVAGKLDIPTSIELGFTISDYNHSELIARNFSIPKASCLRPIMNIPDLPKGASKFPYPMNINMTLLLKALTEDWRINRQPINKPNFPFSIKNDNKCQPFSQPIDLLLVIKSRANDFDLRQAIRETWGNESCWDGWTVRRLFSLGIHTYNDNNHRVMQEAKLYKDIIRQNFLDQYHNNTYKTMMSLDWITKNCPNARLIILVDADVYLQAKNIKGYITKMEPKRRENLYAGLYLPGSSIYRSSKSKWYVSTEEIPWPRYPPFIMGGVVFLTYNNVRKMSMILPYIRYFRIDDALMGILAHKLGIRATPIPSIYLVLDRTEDNSFIAQHFFNSKRVRTSWKKLNGAKYCY